MSKLNITPNIKHDIAKQIITELQKLEPDFCLITSTLTKNIKTDHLFSNLPFSKKKSMVINITKELQYITTILKKPGIKIVSKIKNASNLNYGWQMKLFSDDPTAFATKEHQYRVLLCNWLKHKYNQVSIKKKIRKSEYKTLYDVEYAALKQYKAENNIVTNDEVQPEPRIVNPPIQEPIVREVIKEVIKQIDVKKEVIKEISVEKFLDKMSTRFQVHEDRIVDKVYDRFLTYKGEIRRDIFERIEVFEKKILTKIDVESRTSNQKIPNEIRKIINDYFKHGFIQEFLSSIVKKSLQQIKINIE